MKRTFAAPFSPRIDSKTESALRLYNAAVAAHQAGRTDEALEGYRRALQKLPEFVNALQNMGLILSERGTYRESIEIFKKADAIKPDNPVTLNGMGLAYKGLNQLPDAARCFQRAVELKPDFAGAYINLGAALDSIDKYEKALICYRKALTIDPKSAETYLNMGGVLKKLHRIDEAKAAIMKSLELKPNYAQAFNNLGGIYKDQGNIQESIELLRKSVASNPNLSEIHSNILFCIHCVPGVSPADIFKEHTIWGDRHAPLSKAQTKHPNIPDPERRIRVGYISPDFRDHSCAFFFEPLLSAHNPANVETFAYAQVPKPDKKTDLFKKLFHNWRSIVGYDHSQVAEMVRNDKIDILIECAGHTMHNRLLVLAGKPAPIQVTWLGYPDTTGMRAVDYRLTDDLSDPEGSDPFYTEELVRIPGGFLCFQAHEDAPPIVPPPARAKGYVTFGSFNIIHKTSMAVVEAWARILNRVPNSHLVLKTNAFSCPETRELQFKRFEKLGITRDRIHLHSFEQARFNHLGLYGDIDLALDPFPYNGTTTTCESMWMGVPVLTLRGDIHASRVGAALLTRMGLQEFITHSVDEYVERAVAMANDLDKLERIRTTLRGTMAASTLCDAKHFGQAIEEKFRWMWRRWCEKQGPLQKFGTSSERVEASAVPAIQPTQPVPAKMEAAPMTPQPAEPTNSVAPDAPPAVATNEVAKTSMIIGRVAEMALLADAMARMEQYSCATQYATQGLANLRRGQYTGGLPKALLADWRASSLEGVYLRQCLAYSSDSVYFNLEQARNWLMAWSKLEPQNPEPFLRFGLAFALHALRADQPVSETVLAALGHAARLQTDPRPSLALKLLSEKPTELEYPYYGGMLRLIPDIQNMSTFVMLEQGDWFDKELPLFRSVLRPGDRVLDLGAAVGAYAFSAAALVGSEGQILAIDADARNFGLLQATASHFPHVHAVHAAVGAQAGDARIVLGATPEATAITSDEQAGEPVKLRRATEIANEAKITKFDVVKIDVEGYEAEAIAGARELLESGAPIVFCKARSGRVIRTDVVNALKALGYESFIFSPRRRVLEMYVEKAEIDQLTCNLVAFKPGAAAAQERFEGLVSIV